MLTELTNCLRGQVQLRVECAFPERVLNLCSARGLSFWDLEWESPGAFTCRMRRRDWHRLRPAAEQLGCSAAVLHRQGAPYFLSWLKCRPALAVGLVLCGTALFLSSFFIWEFEITGNHTVPEERILRALEHCGVKRGTFGMVLNGADIRNHVLLDVPELLWIQVNVSGCRAAVEVRERRDWPELLDRRTPSNVIARRPGLVLELRAGDGVGVVTPGSVVREGELLISGVEDTETTGARVLAGRGSVTARTWYTLQASAPLHTLRRQYTGEVRRRYSLTVGTKRVKFFANSSGDGANCDKLTKRTPWTLLGIPLPLTGVEETLRIYRTVPARLAPEAVEQHLAEVLNGYLSELVAPWGTVSSTLVTSRLAGDRLEVTLRAECREEIGVRVPLYQENAEESSVVRRSEASIGTEYQH